jgi:adenosine deaminase
MTTPAVTDYALTYADLKELVRNSIEYSFLPGASLWADKGGYSRFAAECGGDTNAREPSPACDAFLAANAKAAQQWELERRFQAFEAGF